MRGSGAARGNGHREEGGPNVEWRHHYSKQSGDQSSGRKMVKKKRPDRSDESTCDRPIGSKTQGLGPRHQQFHSHPPFPPRTYPRPPHTKHVPPPHVPMSTVYPS